VHPKLVSDRPGHSSLTITLDTYSHVIPTLQETTAEQLASLVVPATVATALLGRRARRA
jgi:hypothetical protein